MQVGVVPQHPCISMGILCVNGAHIIKQVEERDTTGVCWSPSALRFHLDAASSASLLVLFAPAAPLLWFMESSFCHAQ